MTPAPTTRYSVYVDRDEIITPLAFYWMKKGTVRENIDVEQRH